MRFGVLLLAAVAAMQAQSFVDPPEFSGVPKKASKEPIELQMTFFRGMCCK